LRKVEQKNHFLKKSGAKIFLFLLIIFYDFFIVFLLHFFLKVDFNFFKLYNIFEING